MTYTIFAPKTAPFYLYLKGLYTKFYWDFWSNSQRKWHVFFCVWQTLKFQKGVFSAAWALFRRTPLPTIEMSHFPREKVARFRWCLPNLENQQKRQLVALLCFIEGMSIIFGFRCTKLLQIKVQFSTIPHEELMRNSRIFSF